MLSFAASVSSRARSSALHNILLVPPTSLSLFGRHTALRAGGALRAPGVWPRLPTWRHARTQQLAARTASRWPLAPFPRRLSDASRACLMRPRLGAAVPSSAFLTAYPFAAEGDALTSVKPCPPKLTGDGGRELSLSQRKHTRGEGTKTALRRSETTRILLSAAVDISSGPTR